MSEETITLNKKTYDSLVNSEKELEAVKDDFEVQMDKLNEVNKKLALVESGKYVINIRHIIRNKIYLSHQDINNLYQMINKDSNSLTTVSYYLNNMIEGNEKDKILVEDCKLITDLVTERVKYLRKSLHSDLVKELENRNTKIEETSKELMKVKNDLIDSKDKYNKAIYRENELSKKIEEFSSHVDTLNKIIDVYKDKVYPTCKFINFFYYRTNIRNSAERNRLYTLIRNIGNTLNGIILQK